MKRSLVFLIILSCATLHAEERFETGQAARAVIGQRTFTDQVPGTSATLVGAASGLAYANDTLFVADANRIGASPRNHRVLVYNNVSSMVPAKTQELFHTTDCPVCVGQASLVIGQTDFTGGDFALAQNRMRLPTSVATDGVRLAVADTDNNRVLIWNRLPTANGQNADVVVGQDNFTSNRIPPNNTPTNKSLRGPQGVWIQNNRLFIADTQNHRVLIYNSIPTSNGATADIVLGQPDFTTFVEPDLTRAPPTASTTTLLNPVSVNSDGTRLYVTDLGHNRVMIWNSIPTRNQAAADVVLGQPDMTSATANNSEKLCASDGTDPDGKPTYPRRCLATLDFPRYALSDGRRLFIADGGNDRVLIYESVPTTNGQAADRVIGQLGGQINQASDSTDSMRTPMSLAWDGANLYVSDTYNRRIMIYSVAEPNVPYTGVRNAASVEIFAVGNYTLSGDIQENDEIALKISDKEYKYKVLKDDTFEKVANKLANLINADAGDPKVLATPNPTINGIILTSRIPGDDGNATGYSVTVTPATAKIVVATGGATLSGGFDAAKVAPGTIVRVIGDALSTRIEEARPSLKELPTTLADTQVYFDGIRAPLFFVSPTQINAQIPFEVRDRTSVNVYVRTKRADGSIAVTVPRAVTIVPQNPGIFTLDGPEPRQGVVLHGSPFATGTVSVDGSATKGDVAIVVIEDREYKYTVAEGNTLNTIRDALVDLINAGDPKVTAERSLSFTRILLKSRVRGEDGIGIPYSAKATTSAGATEGAAVVMTAFTSATCCANSGLVTPENPAIPGERLILYTTGLGLSEPRTEVTGTRYEGPDTDPLEFVSSLAGGKTANILKASLKQGEVGIYEVLIELNSDLPTNPFTQLTIAQFLYVSNIITFPLVNPNPTTTTP
ncbi:MAG: hypothetical protein ACKV22_25020 [Bryobacteraceae bacterium]